MSARLLAGLPDAGPMSLEQHRWVHGPLPATGAELIDEVTAAGLRGRGGAGFPAGVKLAAAAAGGRPVVVVNGTEGEPMSAKDRALLERTPHLVLDGAEAAARAVGADEVLISASAASNRVLAAALAERGLSGRRGRLRVTLVERAPGYVSGEETAVIAHLEGKRPLPRVTPPRPAERGYRGRPTLVQNVETLAHVALIARHGAAWFREVGTESRPGSMLVTVSGAVRSPGVREVMCGAALSDVVAGAGGAERPVRALLVGGYFGAWVAPSGPDLRLDDDVLRAHGAAVGAGVVVVLDEDACVVAETARLADYLAAESAGQCGPCVHGLGALADVVDRFAAGTTSPGDGERLVRWTEMVRGRGACAHPDGVARMLASATRVFRGELEDHARHGRCASCEAPATLILPAPTARSAA